MKKILFLTPLVACQQEVNIDYNYQVRQQFGLPTDFCLDGTKKIIRTENAARLYKVASCMTIHWPESWDWTLYGAPAYPEPDMKGSGGLTIHQLEEKTHPSLVFYKVKTIACLDSNDVEIDRSIQNDEFFINRYQALDMDEHSLKEPSFSEIDDLMASYGLTYDKAFREFLMTEQRQIDKDTKAKKKQEKEDAKKAKDAEKLFKSFTKK